MNILDKIKNIKSEQMDKGDVTEQGKQKESFAKNGQVGVQVKLPGCDKFVPLGKSQYNRVYEDDIGPRLLIVVDETAELLEPSGIKTTEGKAEDALKQEAVGLLKSLTQLGRSSGMSCIICTQRNDASIIPGVIQNNPLSTAVKLRILRKEL